MLVEKRLNELLKNVGDMALKRRAHKLILDLKVKNEDSIIDLGCGDGFYLYILSCLPIGLKLTGFDNDKIVLRNAKRNLLPRNIKLIEGDLVKIPFKNNSFKKAIMTEVLEHVKDDKRVLAEVYRILKPKGVLILTVPNYNFPFLWDPINWILQKLFGTYISGTNFFAGIWARHLRLYKRNDLVRLIKKTGFKIEEINELTTRVLPFNHYIINLIARLLYDIKPSSKITDSLNKFKEVEKPLLIKMAFFLINTIDKLNDIFPGKYGLNIYIKARK